MPPPPVPLRELVKLFNEGWTIPQLAEYFESYPMHIRRCLKKCGITPPDSSEAQYRALKQKRAIHPTKGKKHSQETKDKISDTQKENHRTGKRRKRTK